MTPIWRTSSSTTTSSLSLCFPRRRKKIIKGSNGRGRRSAGYASLRIARSGMLCSCKITSPRYQPIRPTSFVADIECGVLYFKTVETCVAKTRYFKLRRNAAGLLGFSGYQKISAAMRVLAYRIRPTMPMSTFTSMKILPWSRCVGFAR
jgi:hypothetical protein